MNRKNTNIELIKLKSLNFFFYSLLTAIKQIMFSDLTVNNNPVSNQFLLPLSFHVYPVNQVESQS